MSSLPELQVTVFSDYICPFCYVGHHRLMRLKDSYDIKINWCLLEIHPENSEQGEPITSLDYPSEQWNQLVKNLKRVAQEENIPLSELTFTTNSKNALLLAETSKQLGRDKFYALHEKLFSAYFVEQKNIGDKNILRDIAREAGIDETTVESAWSDGPQHQRLLQNYNAARQYEIQSVPSFIFGERVLTGVVGEDVMRDAAAEIVGLSVA
jgi:predicted DsbA family dithiol-disulfide isomerase